MEFHKVGIACAFCNKGLDGKQQQRAMYPTSVHCRDFLQTVYDTRHKMVMTQDIRAEWDKHASKATFARRWLTNMRRFKRIADVSISPNTADLRNEIDYENVQSEKQRKAMHKDCRLLEAALATDKRVASLDETVRALYHSLAARVTSLREVIWVNPDKPEEESISWLKGGAKSTPSRCLGYREHEEST